MATGITGTETTTAADPVAANLWQRVQDGKLTLEQAQAILKEVDKQEATYEQLHPTIPGLPTVGPSFRQQLVDGATKGLGSLDAIITKTVNASSLADAATIGRVSRTVHDNFMRDYQQAVLDPLALRAGDVDPQTSVLATKTLEKLRNQANANYGKYVVALSAATNGDAPSLQDAAVLAPGTYIKNSLDGILTSAGLDVESLDGKTVKGDVQGALQLLLPLRVMEDRAAKQFNKTFSSALGEYEKRIDDIGISPQKRALYEQMAKTLSSNQEYLADRWRTAVEADPQANITDFMNTQATGFLLQGMLGSPDAATLWQPNDFYGTTANVIQYKPPDQVMLESKKAADAKVLADQKAAEAAKAKVTAKTDQAAAAKTAILEAMAANPLVNGAPRFSQRQVAAAKAELASGGAAQGAPSIADEYNSPQGHIPQFVQDLHGAGITNMSLEDFHNATQQRLAVQSLGKHGATIGPNNTTEGPYATQEGRNAAIRDAALVAARDANFSEFMAGVSGQPKIMGGLTDANGYSYSDAAGRIIPGRQPVPMTDQARAEQARSMAANPTFGQQPTPQYQVGSVQNPVQTGGPDTAPTRAPLSENTITAKPPDIPGLQ